MARPKKNTNTQAFADKMRKAVLQAAIEGKLTDQHQDDGDARELLAQIEDEKQRLITAGEIKRQKSLPDIAEEEKPFDIPDNWEWVRLGNLISVSSGKGLTKAQMIDNAQYPVYGGNGINGYFEDFLVEEGTLTIGRVGFYCGATHKTISKAWVTDNALIVSKYSNGIDTDFLHYFLNHLDLNKSSVATAQPVISGQRISQILLPLPPLAEQQRIVAKLQEVMPQLDSLQADEDALHALQTAFPNQMQASLLQAAIEGKLTQQDATKDGYASDLLTDIEIEKQKLIKAGEIKRSKTLPPISEEEKPFDIPDNWAWVRLGELTYNRGQKKPDKKFSYIDIASIDNKTQRLNSELDTISPSEAPSRARKIVSKGDIIYATVRPYLMNITIVDRNIEPEPIVSTGFAVLATPYQVTNKYLFRVLMSPHFDTYANHNDNAKGVAYPAINDTKLMNGVIPLPPLAEQQRIVDLLEQALPEIQTLKEI